MQTIGPHDSTNSWQAAIPILPLRQAAGNHTFARVRELASPILVWTVWAIMTAATILFIRHYARNVPFMDDFLLVPMMTGHQPVSLAWLWSLHNEHRPVVSRLIMAGLYRGIAPDLRLGMYFSAGLVSTAAALMVVVVRRLRGYTSALDVVLPLSIQNIGQAETVLISFAMNLALTSGISCALVGLASTSGPGRGWPLTVKLGFLLILLPLCGGSGLVMLPPLVLWLAHRSIRGSGRGEDPAGRGQTIGLGLLTVCLAVSAAYMFHYAMPFQHRPPPSFAVALCTFLAYLSLLVCPTWHDYWPLAGLIAALLLGATLVRLGWVGLRQSGERPRAFALSAVILAMLCAGVAVGYSRSFFGPGGGLPSRYITTIAPLFGAIYVAWLVCGPAPARRLVHLTLLGLVILAIPPNIRAGLEFADTRLSFFRQIEHGIRTHSRVSELVKFCCPTPFPGPKLVYRCFVMLKDARVGHYGNLEDDRVAEIPDGRSENSALTRL
jgi:hypothetical protein